MKHKNLAVRLAGWLLAALALPLTAQDDPAPAAPEPDVEEITVTGQRSLMALRLQVEQAEDVVHELFNDLNTDDEYDIVCKTEERVFSKIKEKRCMPVYAWDAMAREGQNFADKILGIPTSEIAPVSETLAYQAPRMKDKMLELLQKHPELLDAVAKHYELLEQLRVRRATYFNEDE